MRGFLLRLLINALGLWVAQAIVPGFEITGLGTYLLAALLLGLVNAIVRPLAIIFTLPLTLITLGFFLLVINGAMLGLVAALLPGFQIHGLIAAILGWLVVSVTGWIANSTIGPRGRFELFGARR